MKTTLKTRPVMWCASLATLVALLAGPVSVASARNDAAKKSAAKKSAAKKASANRSAVRKANSTLARKLSRAEVRAILESVRAEFRVPALAAAFLTSDSISAEVVGVLRADKPDLASLDNLLCIGSCTKSVTATLAGMLVEKGKIQWTTTVSEVFPEFADQIHPDLKNVTLQQLLSHRAGFAAFTDVVPDEEGRITDRPSGLVMQNYIGTPREQRHQHARFLLAQKPAFPLGEFNYSNAGYDLAGAMLGKVAEESYEYLVKTRLTDPLGMDVTFGFPGFNDPNQPWGHLPGDTEENVPLDPNDRTNFINRLLPAAVAGSGNVTLTIADFARYVQMHLRGLKGQQTLLPASVVQFLHTPVGGTPEAPSDYSLGWSYGLLDGEPVSYHTGSVASFNSVMAILPERGIAAVVITNSGGSNAAAIAVAIERLLDISLP